MSTELQKIFDDQESAFVQAFTFLNRQANDQKVRRSCREFPIEECGDTVTLQTKEVGVMELMNFLTVSQMEWEQHTRQRPREKDKHREGQRQEPFPSDIKTFLLNCHMEYQRLTLLNLME